MPDKPNLVRPVHGGFPENSEKMTMRGPLPSSPRMNPVPMLLTCPSCGKRHVDEFEWAQKPHHTHACQHCGTVWRPANIDTVGVRFLPGFRNANYSEASQ